LVIDDDEAMRLALAGTLKASGYDVATAADGAAGLVQYRSAPADLVIVDLYMPGKEGLETLVQLRREFPNVVVIAMSGNRNLGLMLRAAERLGAVQTIAKPFEPAELLALVQKALAE
jgi:DNA-binding response OmpR family regulator